MDGAKPALRAFSACHHKSAARSDTRHLLVNIFIEEIGSNVFDHEDWCLQVEFIKGCSTEWLIALNGVMASMV